MNSTSYILAFSLFLNFSSAQIDGFIFDLEANEPIQNVNISAGDLGTTSGSLGEFSLDVPLGTIIEFSHIGYETVKIKGRSGMSVNMQEKIIQSDEIIVNAVDIRQHAFSHYCWCLFHKGFPKSSCFWIIFLSMI